MAVLGNRRRGRSSHVNKTKGKREIKKINKGDSNALIKPISTRKKIRVKRRNSFSGFCCLKKQKQEEKTIAKGKEGMMRYVV